MTRLRLALEGSRAFRFGGGDMLTPSMEAGLRHDGGDAETGFGADIGAGLAWSDPGCGVSAALRGWGGGAARAPDVRRARCARPKGRAATAALRGDPARERERQRARARGGAAPYGPLLNVQKAKFRQNQVTAKGVRAAAERTGMTMSRRSGPGSPVPRQFARAGTPRGQVERRAFTYRADQEQQRTEPDRRSWRQLCRSAPSS